MIIWTMLRGLAFGFWMLLRAAIVDHAWLVTENIALRLQLAVLQRQAAKLRIRPADRVLDSTAPALVPLDLVLGDRGSRYRGRLASQGLPLGLAMEIQEPPSSATAHLQGNPRSDPWDGR